MALNQGGKFKIMLPFLSLIIGKSEVQHLWVLFFQETSFLSSKFRDPESPLQGSLTFLLQGLLYPTAHKGVKSYCGVLHEATELLLVSSLEHLGFTFYLSPWPLHLGHWHNEAQKYRRKGAVWTIWTVSLGLLTWPGRYLHKDRNITQKSSFSGEERRRGLGKVENVVSFVWFSFQHFASEAK